MVKSKSTLSSGSDSGREQPKIELNPLMPGELPRHSNVQPATIRTIVKLDANSMVWAYEGAASEVEALSPFLCLVMVFFLAMDLLVMISLIKDDSVDLTTRVLIGWIFGPLFFVGGIALIAYLLKISLFSRYADLHFNRKTGKVYTREGNKSIQMDWRLIRPYAELGFGLVQLGAPPMMSLKLVEYRADQPDVWQARFTVASPLPNREGCQQVWELIRRYMEDPPQSMPRLEVAPGGRNWTSALLEFGPLTGSAMVPEFMAKLRARHWRPSINPANILWWFGLWFFPLSTTLYARYRPKADLPEQWTKSEAPLPGELNPYSIAPRDSSELAGRRKAAWIIGIICGICVLLGIVFWSIGAYLLLYKGIVAVLERTFA
jgi:hypothetical protein